MLKLIHFLPSNRSASPAYGLLFFFPYFSFLAALPHFDDIPGLSKNQMDLGIATVKVLKSCFLVLGKFWILLNFVLSISVTFHSGSSFALPKRGRILEPAHRSDESRSTIRERFANFSYTERVLLFVNERDMGDFLHVFILGKWYCREEE